MKRNHIGLGHDILLTSCRKYMDKWILGGDCRINRTSLPAMGINFVTKPLCRFNITSFWFWFFLSFFLFFFPFFFFSFFFVVLVSWFLYFSLGVCMCTYTNIKICINIGYIKKFFNTQIQIRIQTCQSIDMKRNMYRYMNTQDTHTHTHTHTHTRTHTHTHTHIYIYIYI